MNTTFIYSLSCPETKKIRYIGKADDLDTRLQVHLSRAHCENTHKSRWILSLQKRGLVPAMGVLAEVPFLEWPAWEKEYIRVFRAMGAELTNIMDGGDGGHNFPHSEETREKIRKSTVGRIHSLEHREKTRKTLCGRPLSSEHRKNISKGCKGHKPRSWSPKQRKELSEKEKGKRLSLECKLKMSASQKASWARRKEKVI